VTITEGKEGTSRKVKAVDKLRALELDSKLAGDFYADREPQANNPFLYLITLSSQPILGSAQGALPSPAPVIDAKVETLDD